jgi:hypothetical protein
VSDVSKGTGPDLLGAITQKVADDAHVDAALRT